MTSKHGKNRQKPKRKAKKTNETTKFIEVELENNLISMINADTISKQLYYLGGINQLKNIMELAESKGVKFEGLVAVTVSIK